MTKRIISAILCLLCVASLTFSSCSKKQGNDEDSSKDNLNTVENTDVPEVVTDESDNIFIMKVGDREISKAEYKFYYLTYKYNCDMGDNSYWDNNDTMKQYLYDTVLKEIKANCAIDALAKEKNIDTESDEINSSVNSYISNVIQSAGSTDEYYKTLSSMYLSDKFLRSLVRANAVMSKIYDALVSSNEISATDEELLNYINENYVHVKHILLKTQDRDEDEKAAIRAKAESILASAKNGENFEKLVEENSEDGMDVNTGYYFTTGQMLEEFEKASFALEEGEISDLVETVYGYHIIKRYPMVEKEILESSDIMSQVRTQWQEMKFNEMIEQKADTFSVEIYSNFTEVLNQILAEENVSEK